MFDSVPQRVARVKLRQEHVSTGKTNHYVGGAEMPRPVELQIVTYGEDSGYYLFYCDAAGVEMTDTYHDTVEEAMAQAEFEFSVKPDDWDSDVSGEAQR
jgi:hypothetical protein